jgi:amino acid adenylation domain-containing protein
MSQEYFWLNTQLHPDSPTYNIPSVLNITGPLNIPALEKSINCVINRHEALRMIFSHQTGHLKHHIQKQLILDLEQTDFSKVRGQEQLKKLINKEIVRPFNLTTGPLIRVHLIHLDKEKYVLLIIIHHIITDLRSKELLGSEISACYNSIVKDKNLPFFEEPVPYSHLISKYKEWISSKAAETALDFWRNEVQDHSGLIDLPLDHPRPPVARTNGKAHFFQLGPVEAKKLNKFCRQNATAPFIALLSCFLVLLARYSRQKDIIIGVPLSNRRHYETKNVVGCFVNILPLAFRLGEDITLMQILHLVRDKLLQAHRQQEMAFHDIVAAVNPSRDASYNPIFQVGFTYEPPMELQFSGLKVETEKWHNQGSQVDLFLNIFEISTNIHGYFEYNADLFDSETIARISNQYKRLVSNLHQKFDNQLREVEILSKDERKKLLVQWNNTSNNYGQVECLNQLFEKQVTRTPENIAVIFNEVHLTYREFNNRANQVAHYLKEMGVGPEDIVGVCMERSLEMVIAIYAICKAGGAYVPLDPEIPQQRLSFIINETKAKVILTQKHLKDKLSSFDGISVNLDSDWHVIADYPHENPTIKVNPANLAYVIYTSGSTGSPKGVMNEHKGIFNRLMWMQETFKLKQEDKVLQKTPFSFDVSVWEFFWPLFTGATLVVAPPNLHKDPLKLYRIIEEHKITTIHFVPSMLRLFLAIEIAAECKSLKRVFCSGEILTWELKQTFFKRFTCELHNLYGPTEAAVDVSHWQCQPQKSYSKVPIGYPIANTQLYVLDEQLQPVPQGVVGELYIGGVQVARGYLQRDVLTQAAFIPDPFNITSGGNLYKTGDLARYLSNGALEYVGRVDFQVKLNGNRIELMEIEAALCRHQLINESVAILSEEKEDYQQLAAYLLSNVNSIEELNLTQHLEKMLPYYMIPSHFVLLREFPLTASGKVDRKKLPSPQVKKNVLPLNAIQADIDHVRVVSSIWKKILNMDEIDLQSNFFDNGGNSLLATELAFDLGKKLNIKVPLVKIFQYPTVLTLSGYLKEESSRARVKRIHN